MQRGAWDAIYQEAYDYVLPNRRPGGFGKTKRPTQLIFDMTGPNSAMQCAGEIQRQVFPAATPFTLELGPLVAGRIDPRMKDGANRMLAATAHLTYPFFKTGAFDTSMHEVCTDLTIGTGVMLPLKGPSIEQPLIFIAIPQDEVAVMQDAWGRVNFVSWKRMIGREAILEAWPQGGYSEDFRREAASKPYQEIEVFQDFWRGPDGVWRFGAYLSRDGDFIAQRSYRTQPIAVARFYRWPGEAMGRGPVLFALPTIKTANKAQELALKAAAIQLLGIWGYRAGGTFNPNTVRVGPGEFWPMQATGGVLGPDVQRLDPATGRLDIARMVISNQQQQIREALLDTRIADDGGTPASASEIAARMQQNARVHIGAYGRLHTELTAVIVPRAMEILHEWRILPTLMSFNELLVTMSINSPMAAALKADELQAMINYYQLATSVVQAPAAVEQFVKRDVLLDRARQAMLVSPELVPTDDERQAAAEAAQAEQAGQVLGEGAVLAAPQLVQAALGEPQRLAA